MAGVTSGVDQSYLKWVKNSDTTDFPEFSICMRFKLLSILLIPTNPLQGSTHQELIQLK